MDHNLDGLSVQGRLSAGRFQVLQCGRMVRCGVEKWRRNRSSILQSCYVGSNERAKQLV